MAKSRYVSPQNTGKKPYGTPTLQVYGDLREITNGVTVGTDTHKDSGVYPKNRTH